MFPAEVAVAPELGGTAHKPRLRGRARFLRSELLMVFRRRRNLALLVVLSTVPVLIATAVKLGDHRERGDSIFGSITDNGLFAALAALLVVMPLFLPLGVAVVAGDAVSGEANTGTLRYLLAVPVSRTRLLAVKFGAILAWCAASVAVVAVSGLVVGAILFPSGELTLLSGRTVSYAAGGYRLLLVAGYLTISLAMVGALGLFVSTMTEVPVAAMAATSAGRLPAASTNRSGRAIACIQRVTGAPTRRAINAPVRMPSGTARVSSSPPCVGSTIAAVWPR